MDLISREAAIDQTMGKLDYTDVVFDTATESEIVYMLRSLPSVPAVPLDKLCEWLADNCEPPANVSNEKALDDHEFCVTLWRYVLGKMMEEQDAAD